MATFERNTYPSHGNGRYLATSFALHMILFSSIIFLVIEEEITTAKPLPMSVSVMLVDAAEQCPFNKEEQPSLPQKEVISKPIEKVTPITKSVEAVKASPPVEKAVETQPFKSVEQTTPVASPAPIASTPVAQPSSVVQKAPVTPKAVETPIIAAVFNAAYLNNPKPVYPKISKRLGEEGIVLLKVRVLADGTAGSVSVLKSSDFDRLDQSALEAVREWKFVAAKQGERAVESWVSVPVSFKLDA